MQKEEFDILDFSLKNLIEDYNYLTNNCNEFKDIYKQAKESASMLVKKLSKSKEYTFIHGELGPNHVMVDNDNNAFLIDIEGAKFSDLEEENSFLKLRFNNIVEIIDEEFNKDKMLFYHIAHCFGYLRGAIELKKKGYSDIDDLNAMINFFHNKIKELKI